MESATNKTLAEQQRQADIRRQIALLQSQLDDTSEAAPAAVQPKRKQHEQDSNVLVPQTPSKRRRKTERDLSSRTTTGQPAASSSSGITNSVTILKAPPSFPLQRTKVAPESAPASTVLQKLAQAHKERSQTPSQPSIVRSTAFSARPPLPESLSTAGASDAPARDESLALIEDLAIGPREHKAPFDDPRFEKLEPNSGIRLSSRSIPHDDFEDHLRGRYYLSPSVLYSVVRLLPNKQGYDVPVSGDWLTIAVVAERGKMKYTQAPVGFSHGLQGGEDTMDSLPPLDPPAQAGGSRAAIEKRQKAKKLQELDGTKAGGKKYINLKLVDFGCRSRGSSADGGKAKIRGDAFLSLLLFESEQCDVVTKEDGTKEKVYRGGSRGAFERMAKLREGAVVALLNPRILKPFQRSADKPHPTENILALTPESDSSIAVIGYAQDLGRCKATKRDGSRCTSWCDKRNGEICEFHVQSAVERRRAARPEFSVGTSGMSSSAKKKPAYDPARQWGLKPETESSGATYFVSGHVVSGSDARSLFVGESIGREAQAKAARKLAAADADKSLKRLLARDKEGTKALVTAREFSKRQAAGVIGEGKTRARGKTSHTGTSSGPGTGLDSQTPVETSTTKDGDQPSKRNAYSAGLIKHLGFDPTAKDRRGARDADLQSKMDTLAAVSASRTIELGPRPGKKSSCVWRPPATPSTRQEGQPALLPAAHDDLEHEGDPDFPLAFPDSDDDSDDPENEEVVAFGRPVGRAVQEEGMVDLDDD